MSNLGMIIDCLQQQIEAKEHYATSLETQLSQRLVLYVLDHLYKPTYLFVIAQEKNEQKEQWELIQHVIKPPSDLFKSGLS